MVDIKVVTFTFHFSLVNGFLRIDFSGRGTGRMEPHDTSWICVWNKANWAKRFITSDRGFDWVHDEFDFVEPMLPQIVEYLKTVTAYERSIRRQVMVLDSKKGR